MTDEKGGKTAMEMLAAQEEARRKQIERSKGMFNPSGPIDSETIRRYSEQAALFSRAFLTGSFVEEAPKALPSSRDSEERKRVAKWLIKLDHTVTWDDVIGAPEAKLALRGAIEDMTKHPDLYKFYGMSPPRGLLLYGPPGNGKTLLAKATAKALADTYGMEEAELLLVSGPELQSKWFGETEEHIRSIFRYAAKYAETYGHPLIIFMDEADSLLTQRGEGWRFRDDIVSQFLSEMDGLRSTDAFFILASNLPDAIDEAFLRDGRVDRKIKVPRVSREDVGAILLHELRKGMDTWARGGVAISQVVDEIYSPDLVIRVMTNPQSGANHHFNFEHIISGALVVGLVKRAKTIAFERDKLTADRTHIATPQGMMTADLIAAVQQSFEEEKGLEHRTAVQEFIEDVALPAEKKLEQTKWN